MKNIKKYDEFLLEYDVYHDTRSKPIKLNNSTSILDVIKEKAPWYLENIKNITPIYRGLSGKRYEIYNKSRRAMLVSPSSHTRYARNTDNYYIEMIDNSEYWSEYPKRSESIICSFSRAKAGAYGQVYRVIPLKENSKFAICPKDDVFFSFPILFENLKKINDREINNISSFNNWLGFGFGIPDDDGIDKDFIYGRVNSVIDEMNNTDPEDYNIENFNYELRNFSEKVVNGELHYYDFYSQLEEWMEPEENGFKLIKYNRESINLGRMNEVYTDSDCLLVLEHELQNELNGETILI